MSSLFIYQPLTWAFFLVLVPLLIHLINMMRHRRVKWATMEFLLKSHKKHRRWVWLKQLLLLLMRMVAIAAVVAMLAKFNPPDKWSGVFGGKVTHHYVLLDDSYSMSDRFANATAFDRAKIVVGQIAERAINEQTPQKFTLIRFSQAVLPPRAAAASADEDSPADDDPAGATTDDTAAATTADTGAAENDDVTTGGSDANQVADLGAELVGADFKDLLEARQRGYDVTQLAVRPEPALAMVRQLFEESDQERRLVYVVSDFRAAQWAQAAELREGLRQLEEAGADIHLVSCVKSQRPNLAIIDLQPTEGTRAAGVPLFANVKIRNYAAQPAKDVQLKIRSLYYDPAGHPSGDPSQLEPQIKQLPTELIESIGPGQTVTRRVQIYFPGEGKHVVEAILPDDPIAVDNRRYCVIDFPATERILIVDGQPRERGDHYYLTSAFQPGKRAKSGLESDLETAEFLRDKPVEILRQYRAIYLLNVARLDERAVANLGEYVRGGGGVAFFMGPEVDIAHYNANLYRGDQGLFPLELDRREILVPILEQNVPDFEVSDHPIFSIFASASSISDSGIAIEQYIRASDEWAPTPESNVRVLARLRRPSGQPLVVERQFGEGRVVAFLSTLAPTWNSWAIRARGVAAFHTLQWYLAAPRQIDRPRLVGVPIEMTIDADRFQPELRLVAPAADPLARRRVELRADKPDEEATVYLAALGSTKHAGQRGDETSRRGIYEAWASSEGKLLLHDRYALNVEPGEGNLEVLPPTQLVANLKPVTAQFHYLEDVALDSTADAGGDWSRMILYVLIVLLLGEQLLAYSASYHPARGGAR